MAVTVVGSIHVDFYILVERFPRPGETLIGHGYHFSPGGKGANQAVGCGRLGERTFMVGRIGRDFKDYLLDNFRSNNVNVDFVKVDDHRNTGVAFIILNEKTRENMIFVDPGADYHLSTADVDDALPAMEESRVVLLQMEIPGAVNKRAAEIARSLGKVVILNPAPVSGDVYEIAKHVHVITPNAVEAEYISGVPVTDANSAARAGRKILELGPEHVVVTLGARGAVLVTRDEALYYPAFRVEPVDTTGAGDAFNAGLAVAISRGLPMEEAVLWGVAAGAIKVTKMGAQAGLPREGELLDFLDRNRDYSYTRL
ncbi:MAG: ribokinase [Desulfurococcaceae archaeon]